MVGLVLVDTPLETCKKYTVAEYRQFPPLRGRGFFLKELSFCLYSSHLLVAMVGEDSPHQLEGLDAFGELGEFQCTWCPCFLCMRRTLGKNLSGHLSAVAEWHVSYEVHDD